MLQICRKSYLFTGFWNEGSNHHYVNTIRCVKYVIGEVCHWNPCWVVSCWKSSTLTMTLCSLLCSLNEVNTGMVYVKCNNSKWLVDGLGTRSCGTWSRYSDIGSFRSPGKFNNSSHPQPKWKQKHQRWFNQWRCAQTKIRLHVGAFTIHLSFTSPRALNRNVILGVPRRRERILHTANWDWFLCVSHMYTHVCQPVSFGS